MEFFEPYGLGILALLIFVLIVLVQSALVGAGKANAGMIPGSEPEADYDNSVYRLNRSHQNAVEIMPAAAIVLFSCILLGVSAWWVNTLMVVFLLTRIVYAVIYARNVGKPTQGTRTFAYVAGWAMLVILCLMAIWASF